MPKIVFAWEAGENFGHLAKDIPVALRLRDSGASVQFIVKRLDIACALLTRHGFEYFQAPASARRFTIDGKARTHSEWFGKLGYWDSHNLMGQVRAWKALFRVLDPDVVVSDFSPTSLLAARIDRVPAVLFGTGFEVPPALAPMPWRSCDETEDRRLMVDTERRSLAAINDLFERSDTRPIGSISDLFRNLPRCLTTFAELDHYVSFGFARDAKEFIGHVTHAKPATPALAPQAGRKPSVFVYLRPFVPGLECVLEALASLDVHASCHIPELAPGVRARHAGKLEFLERPLDVNTGLDAFDLVINYAGAGMVSEALARGIPMLLLPCHNEQNLTAAAAERLGAALVLRDPQDANGVARSIEALLAAGSTWKTCAGRYRHDHRDHDPSAAVEQAARTILAAAGAPAADPARRETILLVTELGPMLDEMPLAGLLARTLSEAGVLPVVSGFDDDRRSWNFEHVAIAPAPRGADPSFERLPENHAELLAHFAGFLDADSLLASVRHWVSALLEHAVSKVVGVAAPAAMLAARALGLPRVAIDSGYYTIGSKPTAPHADSRGAGTLEGRCLATANAVLAQLAAAPLRAFDDLFSAELKLVAAPAALDPHHRDAGEVEHVGSLFDTLLGPIDAPHDGPGSGPPRVAILLHDGYPGYDELLDSLASAGASVDVRTRHDAIPEGRFPANLRFHATARSLEQALGSVDLAICHGGVADVHRLVHLGVPVAALPRHADQRELCRALRACGLGWVRDADSQEPVDAFVRRLLDEATDRKAHAERFRRAHPPANAWVVGQRILALRDEAFARDRAASTKHPTSSSENTPA